MFTSKQPLKNYFREMKVYHKQQLKNQFREVKVWVNPCDPSSGVH